MGDRARNVGRIQHGSQKGSKLKGRPTPTGFQRTLANIGYITGSNLIGRVLNLVLHAVLARLFGPPGLGGYATAVAVAAYFVFLVDFGLSPRIAREGAVSPDKLAEEYASALGLKLLTGCMSLIALAGICVVLPYEDWVRDLCFLLGCSAIIRSFSYLNESVCRASERLDLEGAASLLGTSAFTGLALVFLALDYPIHTVGYASIVGNCAQLLLSTIFARRLIPLRFGLPPDWKTARAALPYATTSFSMLAFAQIDVLMVSLIESTEFVGRYVPASRLLMVVGTIGGLAASAVLPTASRVYANSSAQEIRALINESVRGILLLGGFAALGTVIVARPAIVTIYGEAYADVSSMLQVGSVYLVFNFATSILATNLTAIGRQGDRARSMLLGLAATIILVLAFVPWFGMIGAISAMVGSELALAVCLGLYLRQTLEWIRLLSSMSVVLFALASGAALHFRLAADAYDVISIALPLLLYIAVTLAIGQGVRTIRFIANLHERR